VQSLEELRLLQRARVGDRAAADALLEPNRDWLTTYFRRRVHDEFTSQSYAQDVLSAAYGQLDRFRGGCLVSQWLLGIANNVWKRHLERDPYRAGRLASLDTNATQEFLTVTEPAESLGGGAAGQAKTEDRLFAEALLQAAQVACSVEERMVLLRVYQGNTLEEVAELLAKPSGTVRALLKRGREKLLAYLVEHQADLLGGQERVAAAWQRALAAESDAERPSPSETAAWKEGKERHGTRDVFRSACLKMARHLPVPLFLLGNLLLHTAFRGGRPYH